MGFLESLVSGIESLGKDGEEDPAFTKAAERLAEKEKGWVKEQISLILLEAAELQLSSTSTMQQIQDAHKKMSERLTKFAEEAFQRGAKAASRMNVIQGQ
jgi:hypothetical protein